MLYIMRHGKTDWNVLHKLQGRTDIPLNEEGRNMARKAADIYKDINFDVCYCSPLKRAKETAEILLEGRNIPIIRQRTVRLIYYFRHLKNTFLLKMEKVLKICIKGQENF